MRGPKRSRTVRSKRLATMLQERDLEVLVFLAVVKYAEPGQIASAAGIPSLDRARRVLRRLYDAGLVSVTMTSSTAPNLVSLSKAGLEQVRLTAPDVAARARLSGIRLQDVARHLLLVEARLFAAALGEARGGALLRFLSTPASVAKELGLPGLVPAALAAFAYADGAALVAIEVDVAGTSADSVLRRLNSYRSATDHLDALWVVSVGDAARVRQLEARLSELGIDEWARILPRATLSARPAVLPARPPSPSGNADTDARRGST